MKRIPFLCTILCILCFSCTHLSDEAIVPQAEKFQTCHLQKEAIVEYTERGHEDGSSEVFYYLALLENDKRGDDVYAGNLPEDLKQVGKKIQIVYHVNPQGDYIYMSACGDGPEAEPVMESMKSIVPCKMGEGLF